VQRSGISVTENTVSRRSRVRGLDGLRASVSGLRGERLTFITSERRLL